MNLTSFGTALHINPSTLYIWYRDVLSDYAKDKGKSVHKNDVKRKGKKVIRVPIFKEENFGEKMAIDEKLIGEDIYTIMSNRKTGKLAMVCQSLNFKELKAVFEEHQKVVHKVKSLTSDFSLLYKKIGKEVFVHCIPIIDKFHVIKNLMDANQAIRVRYRQKELEKRRKAHNEFKANEKMRLEACEYSGKSFKPRKFHYREQQFENKETALQLLARSRYLLFKFQSQWTQKQTNRANILFRIYPEIRESYQLTCQFRKFMSKKNVGKHYLQIDKKLHQWYEDVEQAQIDELLNFKTLVETNEQEIENYFLNGETNALAEANNRKIKQFISSNQGTRDRDFFFSRLEKFYA